MCKGMLSTERPARYHENHLLAQLLAHWSNLAWQQVCTLGLPRPITALSFIAQEKKSWTHKPELVAFEPKAWKCPSCSIPAQGEVQGPPWEISTFSCGELKLLPWRLSWRQTLFLIRQGEV